MTKRSEDELIVVAKIAGAFGVDGEVKLRTFTEVPEAAVGYGPLLGVDGRVVLTPGRHRPVKNALAVRAREVRTREDAEAMKGTLLHVRRGDLPEPEEDEFYHEDLVGLEVKSTDGKRLGRVIAVHDFGARPMLEIKPKEGASFFHPFTQEFVPKVEIGKGRIVAHVVEAEIGKET